MRTLTASERIERAYATLELPPVSPPRETLRQYRRLVKRWHPDRYANDPQGQAEASQRMREINAAFAVLRPTLSRFERPAPSSPKPPTVDRAAPREPTFGARLRPDEVDAIVDVMAGPSMFEIFFRLFGRGLLVVGGLTLLAISSRGDKPVDLVLGVALLVLGVSFIVNGYLRGTP